MMLCTTVEYTKMQNRSSKSFSMNKRLTYNHKQRKSKTVDTTVIVRLKWASEIYTKYYPR